MSPQAGATRVRGALEALTRGDLQDLIDSYSEDVVFHVGRNHLVSGGYRGRDHLMKYFELTGELTGKPLRIDRRCILANERHVVMFTHVTTKRGTRQLDITMVEALAGGIDGRCTEYWALADDQLDAFWS